MNTFSKVNGEWAVQVSNGGSPGDVITVTKRGGDRTDVTLGELIRENQYGRLFKIVSRPRRQAETFDGEASCPERSPDRPVHRNNWR